MQGFLLRGFLAAPPPFLLVAFLLSCGGATAQNPQQTPQNPPAATQASPSPAAERLAADLECEVFCSDTKPRTSVAAVIWKPSERPRDRQGLETFLAQRGLEVTVHKDGFNKGLFASVASIRPGEKLLFRGPRGPAQERAPGLENLVVVDVHAGGLPRDTRGQSPPPRSPVEPSPDSVIVQVEGLEPGLNYYWRIATEAAGSRAMSPIVRCQAPVCPADFPKGAQSP